MAPKLVAEEGLLKGQEILLEGQEEWVIGRDPAVSQLVMEDPAVSRQHVACKATPEGILLENLSSTNPVEVNDALLSEPQLLQNGDSIKIGDSYWRFFAEESVPVEKPPEAEEPPVAEEAPVEEAAIEEASTEEVPQTEEVAEETAPTEEVEEEVLTEEALQTEEVAEESPTEEIAEETAVTEEVAEETGLEDEDSIFEEEGEEELISQVDLDLKDSSPWLLKVLAGPNNGAQFSMQPGTSYVIGTDPATCDLVFHDASVSRQHARLTISEEGKLSIEDLGSSNGTLIESDKAEGKQEFEPNTLITLGTSSFVVYDREGERKTLISPLLPSIVKILQQPTDEEQEGEEEAAPEEPVEVEEEPVPEERSPVFKYFVISFIGLIALFGFLLFRAEEVPKTVVDANKVLEQITEPFPTVRFSFNSTTGRLLLVGHVLSNVDHEQILYNIKPLKFVKDIDDYIVIDENIWRETNQVLGKNPNWKGVTVQAPVAGKFVISGYIQNRAEAEALSDYLAQNFPYIDLLEQRIVVEEDLKNRTKVLLLDNGMQDVEVKINAGDVILSGKIPFGEKPTLDAIVSSLKEIPGVRDVKAYVSETSPMDTLVDLTDEYTVEGVLREPSGKINVVINGKILSEGDSLDGRVITKIEPDTIYLEGNGIKYRIDYNR